MKLLIQGNVRQGKRGLRLKHKILVRRKHLEALFTAAETLLVIAKGKLTAEDLAVGDLPALSLKSLRTQRRLRREMKRLQRNIEELRADRQRYLGSNSKSVWMALDNEQSPIERNPPKKKPRRSKSARHRIST